MSIVERTSAKSDIELQPLEPDLKGVLRRRLRKRSRVAIRLATGWIATLVVISLTVQWMHLHSYSLPAGPPNVPPHWGLEFFGTDAAGRSMLSRVLFGTRISMIISCGATAISLSVGGTLGLICAYFGPPISAIGDIIANSVLSIPALLLIMAIVLALSSSIPVIIIACSLLSIPAFLRLTKAHASGQLARDFVLASRGLGASKWRIIFKEVLPNTAPSLISYAALVLPSVIIIEGSLSFLGFGLQSPTPSWGDMIALGDPALSLDPWQSLIPCVFLVVTVYSLNTIGDYWRARLATRGAGS